LEFLKKTMEETTVHKPKKALRSLEKGSGKTEGGKGGIITRGGERGERALGLQRIHTRGSTVNNVCAESYRTGKKGDAKRPKRRRKKKATAATKKKGGGDSKLTC